jgi:hypothetical protein
MADLYHRYMRTIRNVLMGTIYISTTLLAQKVWEEEDGLVLI